MKVSCIPLVDNQPVVYENEKMPVADMSPMPYADLINGVLDAMERTQDEDEDRAFGEPSEILGVSEPAEIMTPLKHLRAIVEHAKSRADSDLVEYAFGVFARLSPRPKEALERVRRMQGDWNVVYDLRDKTIFFRTTPSYELKSIRLDDFDFPENAPEKMADLNLPVSGNFVPHLGSCDPAMNTALVKKNYTVLYSTGRVAEKIGALTQAGQVGCLPARFA